MTRFRGFFTYVTILIFIFSVIACKNQKSSQDYEDTDQRIEITDEKDELIQEFAEEYPIPTSFEVTTMLEEAQAAYMFLLCNPVSNVDRYLTQRSKALNLGVYGADLSYAATYNQAQESGVYLEACAKLIDELQISSGFNEALVQRVENNINDDDSLINIISETFYDTYEYLQSNEQDDLSILIMAGSWIEALYITTQMSDLATDKTPIIEIVANQNTSLETLIEVMEPISDSDMASDIYIGLQELHELYKGASDQMTPEQLSKVIALADSLRTMIIR